MNILIRKRLLRPQAIRMALIILFSIFGATTPALAARIPIKIDETVGLDRTAWPVGIGFPFAKGEIKDLSSLTVLSPQNLPLPFQGKVLSRWPDNSVRWAHVLFFAELPRQQTQTYWLEWDEKPKISATGLRGTSRIAENPVHLVESEALMRDVGSDITFQKPGAKPPSGSLEVRVDQSKISVRSGRLDVVFSPGSSFFDRIRLSGMDMIDPGQKIGFLLKTPDGRVFNSAQEKAAKLEVEESGPLRAVVRREGSHFSADGKKLFDYVSRVIFYAGKDWFELEYRFADKEDAEWTEVSELSLSIPLAASPGPYKGTSSEYKIDKFWEFDEPFSIYSGKEDFFGVFGGARIFESDGAEIIGTGYESEARARWWADSSTPQRGLTVSIRDMSQNYPKEIRVAADKIVLGLYPEREPKPLRFHQGWEKTQTMFLYFHRGDALAAGSRELCFEWQAPPAPWSPHHIESGSLGALFPYSPQKYPMIERSIRAAFQAYIGGVGRGMIDYADTVGPGSGERGNFMQNNCYDTPWVLYLLFLRTGEARYWQMARATALHTADIDIVHHSTRTPVEVGGVRIHGANHVQYGSEAIAGSSVAPNHEWVEGLLMTYHLTGERRYLDLAVGLADHILRAIDAGWILPPYNAKWNGARNLGWPLIILSVMYDATGKKEYLEGAKKIIKGLASIQLENGSFPITIGPYVGAAPLHNAIVMEAVGRYHEMTGDDTVIPMFMRCAESTVRDIVFPDGDWIYITHPDYRMPYTSTPWGGFHFAYLFSKDKKFLEFPYALIMRQLRNVGQGLSSAGFSTGEGALSYPLRGILFYLTWADKAGMLKDLPAF